MDIVPCIGCTQRCMTFNDHDTLLEGDWGVSCMYNPFSNNRKEVQYEDTETPKKSLLSVPEWPAWKRHGWLPNGDMM